MRGHTCLYAALSCVLALSGCASATSVVVTNDTPDTTVVVSDPVAETEDPAPAAQPVTVTTQAPTVEPVEEEVAEPICVTDREAVASVTEYADTGQEMGRTVYEYDDDGNLAAALHYRSGSDEPGVVTYTYTSDGIMASATGDNVAVSQRVTERDRSGLPTQVERVDAMTGETYSYLIAWRDDGSLESVSVTDNAGGSWEYAYDASGRLLTSPYATYTYAYDDSSRVTGIGSDTDATGVSYTYDDGGRIASRTRGNEVTTYLYDGAGNPIAEYVDGVLARTYSYVDVAPCDWTLATARTNVRIDFLNTETVPAQMEASVTGFAVF